MNKSEAGKLGSIASLETLTKLKQSRIDAYNADPKKCLECDSIIDYSKKIGKFCTRSCAASFNNKLHPKRSNGYVANCKYCNEIIRGRKQRENLFCDNKCRLADLDKIRNTDFEQGKLSSVVAKKVLVSQHGLQCMECGWDKINSVSNKCPVELEHMDGNSQNNLPENLKLLCPNCHSLTPTYKALNVGKGRFSRMQRYNEGKSS
jgi:hypothetical protein